MSADIAEHVAEYIDRIKGYYRERLASGFELCSGWPTLKLVAKPSPEDVAKTLRQLSSPYPTTTMDYWSQHLVCVLLGQKPTALIENDFLPVPDPKTITDELFGKYTESGPKEIDSFLRYVAEKCGVRHLVVGRSEDPTTIYYRDDSWQDACVLYLYHERLLSPALLQRASEVFDEFQGILLGYTLPSQVVYALGHSWIPADMSRVRGAFQEQKDVTQLMSKTMQRQLYNSFYAAYQLLLPEVSKKYQEAAQLIKYIKSKLGEEHRSMCLGVRTVIK